VDRTILVVEDDFANQQVALLFLKKLGYSSEIAANGKVAVDLTLKKKYPLILMDCQMPVLSGFEASIAIRNSDGPNQQTPIIALTANMVENVVEQCKKSGIDDILNKPINIDNMTKILAKWIGQSSICTVAS
jgi:CheY-like chemotaxis protein